MKNTQEVPIKTALLSHFVNNNNSALLLCKFSGFSLLQLGNPGCRFGTKDTTAPVSPDFISPLIEVGLHTLNELGELGTITRVNLKGTKIIMLKTRTCKKEARSTMTQKHIFPKKTMEVHTGYTKK